VRLSNAERVERFDDRTVVDRDVRDIAVHHFLHTPERIVEHVAAALHAQLDAAVSKVADETGDRESFELA
jgi:hypothetical protein